MKVETIRYEDGKLILIDQRVLPNKVEYVILDNVEDIAKAITDMVVRGAPAIGVTAAFGIAITANRYDNSFFDSFKNAIKSAFEVLAKSRPTAVNLFWALAKMQKEYDYLLEQSGKTNITQKIIAEKLLNLAQQIYHDDININLSIGENGAKLLGQNVTVLTHCNAGALATAGHGTALGVIRSAVAMGKKISVFADETRPFLQGARLTAWEMVQENIPCTLITDNMAGHLMAKGEIDAVIVGTDRVAANGDVCNKIGTYMLAVLANYHKIPFYVACPLSTIDINTKTGADIPIEERNPDEVRGFGGQIWAPEGVNIRNPAFDVTPANLVSAIITEKGVINNPDFAGIKTLLEA